MNKTTKIVIVGGGVAAAIIITVVIYQAMTQDPKVASCLDLKNKMKNIQPWEAPELARTQYWKLCGKITGPLT